MTPSSEPSQLEPQSSSLAGQLVLAALLCLLATYFGPWQQLAGLELMPAGIGDTRLNNYFLENVYQYLSGGSPSLWHLPMFHPAPYVLGLSDNLFGSAPIYVALRFGGFDAFTSYQLWFLLAYPLNFAGAWFFAHKMRLSWLGAAVVALVYAFALPIVVQADHSQLQYRCATPFAIAYFIGFLRGKRSRDFVLAAAFAVLQLVMGVYIGFFTLLLLAALAVARCCYPVFRAGQSTKALLLGYWQALFGVPAGASSSTRRSTIALLAAMVAALIWLFYPYIAAKSVYQVSRSWGEIQSMLPRLYSYVLADHSLLWPSAQWELPYLPQRHEHQLFVGLIVLICAILGSWLSLKQRLQQRPEAQLLFYSAVTVIGVTLYIGWHSDGERLFQNSFWQLFVSLPLASAIRAMSRVILVLLLPIGYLAALGVENLAFGWASWAEAPWAEAPGSEAPCAEAPCAEPAAKGLLSLRSIGVGVVLLGAILVEYSWVETNWTAKAEWHSRVERLMSSYGEQLSLKGNDQAGAIFVAQTDYLDADHELDVMWLAARLGRPTVNGYSGHLPLGFRQEYFDDCRELPKRMLVQQQLVHGEITAERYREDMAQVQPLGFAGCEDSWWQSPPENITLSSTAYTDSDFSQISAQITKQTQLKGGYLRFDITLRNAGSTPIAALGPKGYHPTMKWRLVDGATGKELTGGTRRGFLVADLPAEGELKIAAGIGNGEVNDAKRALAAADGKQGIALKLFLFQKGRNGQKGARSADLILPLAILP